MDMIHDPHGARHTRREVWVLLAEKCSCHGYSWGHKQKTKVNVHDTGIMWNHSGWGYDACIIHLQPMPSPPHCHHHLPQPLQEPHVTFAMWGFPFQTLWFNFSDKVIKANLITMTHGLQCVLQTLILFTVLGEWAIITKAGTECF